MASRRTGSCRLLSCGGHCGGRARPVADETLRTLAGLSVLLPATCTSRSVLLPGFVHVYAGSGGCLLEHFSRVRTIPLWRSSPCRLGAGIAVRIAVCPTQLLCRGLCKHVRRGARKELTELVCISCTFPACLLASRFRCKDTSLHRLEARCSTSYTAAPPLKPPCRAAGGGCAQAYSFGPVWLQSCC